jgi:CheY-like chemotaxis protein
VDPAQIDQVLVNLAVNAREAMPDGGTLSLETAPVPTPPSLSARSEGYLALTVRDTGHGMDEKTRERVFEPFFTTKGESGGSGLGLAMVDGIVRQSGGAVFVESAPGSGSSFQVVLPRALGPPAGVPARAADGTLTMGGETVLVVEDDPAIRALTCEMLELHGYTTLRASSAEEALRLADRHPGAIHLLLSDVVMPGLGGPALAERFLEVRAEAQVLFMSGYPGEDLARRGLTEPVSRLLPKPFTADQLAARVRECLDAG